MNTVYELDEKEIAKAVAYWLENGTPEPKKPGSVHFSYDDPNKGNQFDHGAGVSARVTLK